MKVKKKKNGKKSSANFEDESNTHLIIIEN